MSFVLMNNRSVVHRIGFLATFTNKEPTTRNNDSMINLVVDPHQCNARQANLTGQLSVQRAMPAAQEPFKLLLLPKQPLVVLAALAKELLPIIGAEERKRES